MVWVTAVGIAIILAQMAFAQGGAFEAYGSVQVEGQDVPDGTIIQGSCSDTVYGETASFSPEGASIYTFAIAGDNPLTEEVDGCLAGETILFTIGPLTAFETATWVSGGNQEINLTAESPRPEITIKKFTNNLDVGSSPGPYIPSGQPITWTYVISNTGNVPLTDIDLKDDNGTPGGTGDDIDVCSYGELNPGVHRTCYHYGFAGEGQFENMATASAYYTTTISASDSSYYYGAWTEVEIEKSTNGENADLAPGLYIAAGQPITWTYVITNSSNVDLSNVTASDDMGTPGDIGDDIIVCDFPSMEPGQAEICTYGGGTAVEGQYSNVASVVGTPPAGLTAVSDQDGSNYYGIKSSLTFTKSTNGAPADLPPGPLVRLGSQVDWTYLVDNTSNITLTNVTVSDNLVSDISCNSNILGPGEVMVCEASAMADHLGQYTNLGIVSGDPPAGLATITDTNPSHYYGVDPAITIEKFTNGEDADLAPGPFILEGDPITWTYTVSNTGNITLTNINVTDPLIAGLKGLPVDYVFCNIGSLGIESPQATCEVYGTAEIGQHTNSATAVADVWAGLGTVEDTDASHYFGSIPMLDIEKYTNGEDADRAPGPLLTVGDLVTWTYMISNTGNVTLTNVSILDDVQGAICVIPTINPGAQPLACQMSSVVGLGQYANRGTVMGTWPTGDMITAEDWSHYYGAFWVYLPAITKN